MQHATALDRFNYENNGRLTGQLEQASWLMDQTAWGMCPLLPIPDAAMESSIRSKHQRADAQQAELLTRQWMRDCRHDIKGFDHAHATFNTGVEGFIDSAIYRCSSVSSLPLTYYHVPDVAAIMGRPHSTPGDAPAGSLVIMELPTPHHTTEHVSEQISLAKSRGHYVAVDMTFLPVSTTAIEVDLTDVDEVWVSMNKAWDTGDLRPAWRFSRTPRPDALTLAHERSRYNRDSMAAWQHIITTRTYDDVALRNLALYQHVCGVFGLSQTNNMLVARLNGVTWEPMYTKNWNYNGLVGTHGLIGTHGKHFW